MALILELPETSHYLRRLPRAVDPEAARQFNELADACDRIAKEFSGKLTAVVDHEFHLAWLEIDCVFAHFFPGEHLETLRRLVAAATGIRILPVTSELLRIRVALPYFQSP